eukprot:EG_transcript_27630
MRKDPIFSDLVQKLVQPKISKVGTTALIRKKKITQPAIQMEIVSNCSTLIGRILHAHSWHHLYSIWKILDTLADNVSRGHAYEQVLASCAIGGTTPVLNANSPNQEIKLESAERNVTQAQRF